MYSFPANQETKVPAFIECIEDPAIPTLEAVLNPVKLSQGLCEYLPSHFKGIAEPRVRVLRHHVGKRCVVEIALQTTEGPLWLVGKVYSRNHSHVFQLMKAISKAGFGPKDKFSIPQPVAYVLNLELLLQQKVEGRPSTESFLSEEESMPRATAERCALWLAKLHTAGPRVGTSFGLDRHLSQIQQWFSRVLLSESSLAGKAVALFDGLARLAASLRDNEMVPVHGDYTHHQVMLDGGRTLTTDWDNYAVGDPARDVAHFLVGLQRFGLRSGGSLKAMDIPGEIFLQTYVAARGCHVLRSLPFQKAAACLEHAKHDVHKRAYGWRERAEEMLNEGLRILTAGA
jgi:aminoglycoside phosphotransferase (APT) family kinase protein